MQDNLRTDVAACGHRFYDELARWWPLISPVDEYAEEAAEFARIVSERCPSAQTLLELGSGGGHNAWHLKRHYALTLSDLSERMLTLSRALNPECTHVLGDMRTLRVGQSFDVVFVHDAIAYMTNEADLSAAFATAFVHCRPGGIALFACDDTRETFEPGTDCGGTDGPDGSGVRYLEWSYDPDPQDDQIVTEYAFMYREADGRVGHVCERHQFGLFSASTWLELLRAQGFVPEQVTERTAEDRLPRTFFVGRRPG